MDENLKNQKYQQVMSLLKRKDYQALAALPYLKEKASEKMLQKVFSFLELDFDEEVEDTQQFYFQLLDKVIDGCVKNNYETSKEIMLYPDIVSIQQAVMEAFHKAEATTQIESLEKLATRFVQAADDSSLQETYFKNIMALFKKYLNTKTLSKEETAPFYNDILNRQQNAFYSKEKQEIVEALLKKLPLTKKKQESLIRGEKRKVIAHYLQTENYEALGITAVEYHDLLEQMHRGINSLKEVKKTGRQIDAEEFKKLDHLFSNGKLDQETMEVVFPTADKKLKQQIMKRYNQIPLLFQDKIKINPNSIEIPALGFNYNNYVIASKERYYQNVATILLELKEEEIEAMSFFTSDTEEELEDLKPLLPLAGLSEPFTEKMMQSFFVNYPRIQQKLKENHDLYYVSSTTIFSYFGEAMKMASAYSDVDDIVVAALGKEVLETIDRGMVTSNDPKVYLETYEKMLKKTKVMIPPVFGETEKYYYFSGDNKDEERLLIGKLSPFSCIGPEGAGKESYQTVLTEENGDVVLLKDKTTGKICARALMFRLGNAVMIASFHGPYGLEERFHDKNMVKEMAAQMLEQAALKEDNLDYILFTNEVDYFGHSFPLLYDMDFERLVPHADITVEAYQIATRENAKKLSLKEDVTPRYETRRESVKTGEDVVEKEVTKLRALRILMTPEKEQREDLAREFEPFKKEKGMQIYQGHDWYAVVLDNHIKEEVVVPTGDPRQDTERLLLHQQLIEASPSEKKTSDFSKGVVKK